MIDMEPHKKALGMVFGLYLFTNASYSWAEDTSIEVIFITSERMRASNFETPYVVDQISAEDIKFNLSRNLPDALKAVNGVMVQKTAYGQGSPYIRGFTGYRTLFLFDGVRLNNSTFREGPNQYWNTVDAFSIDKLEIVKGPNSALYGADAIGGTVQALSAELDTTVITPSTSVNYFYRGATAEHSNMVRTAVRSNRQGVAFQLGGSYKDFGDLTRGHNIDQPNTGYREYNADAKLAINIAPKWSLISAAYLTQQDDVPRTHKTIYSTPFAGTTIGSELSRDLTQKHLLTYLKLIGQELNKGISDLQMTFSFQQQKEHRERLRSQNRFDLQGVRTNTLGLQLQMTSHIEQTSIVYGFDAYLDNVDSYSTSNEIQGPVADDAGYLWLGAYLQGRIELNRQWDMRTGLRVNYMHADADKISDPNSANQLTLDKSWSETVGNIMFNYRLDDHNYLYSGIAQGFRAPNLSDLTRFDTARTNEFEIPATHLDSEHYTNYSIGFKHHSQKWMLDWSAFYTAIDDQIERIPTGQQNSDGEFEISKENIGDGYFSGTELSLGYRFSPAWMISAQAAYITGKHDTFRTSERIKTKEYASRLMPSVMQLELNYTPPQSAWKGKLKFSTANTADRLSPRDQLDSSRIPPNGTPGYGVLSLHTGYMLSEKLEFSATIENIFDKDYRIHGSGQNEAGRNLIIGISGQL